MGLIYLGYFISFSFYNRYLSRPDQCNSAQQGFLASHTINAPILIAISSSDAEYKIFQVFGNPNKFTSKCFDQSEYCWSKFLIPNSGNLVMNLRQMANFSQVTQLASLRAHNIDMDLNIIQTFTSNSVKLMSVINN